MSDDPFATAEDSKAKKRKGSSVKEAVVTPAVSGPPEDEKGVSADVVECPDPGLPDYNPAGLILQLIPKVAKAIGPVAKGQYNQQQKFNFRGIDDVYNACSRPIFDNGITVIPRVNGKEVEIVESRSGFPMRYVTVDMSVKFVAPDGSYIEAHTFGEAMDSGDKAMSKAQSIAIKQIFFQVFVIPVEGIDPDAESHEIGKSNQITPNSPPHKTNPPPKTSNAPTQSSNPAPIDKPKTSQDKPKTSSDASKPASVEPAESKPLTATEIENAKKSLSSFNIEKTVGCEKSIRKSALLKRAPTDVIHEFSVLYFTRLIELTPPEELVLKVGNRLVEFVRDGLLTEEHKVRFTESMESKLRNA